MRRAPRTHRRPSSSLAALFVAIAVFASAAPGRAAEDEAKHVCVDSSEVAQRLRASHKLIEARAELVTCSAGSCPAVVQRYCGKWLTEVEALVPSVVLRVRDERGRDVEPLEVTLDGARWEAPVDGRVAELDPGAHTLGFRSGAVVVERRVVIVSGEKNRVLEILWPGSAASRPATDQAPRPTSSLLPLGLGGLALGALGVFTFFSLTGTTELLRLHAGCGQTVSCREEAVDDAVTKLRIADASLVTGVLLAGAAVLVGWRSHQR